MIFAVCVCVKGTFLGRAGLALGYVSEEGCGEPLCSPLKAFLRG